MHDVYKLFPSEGCWDLEEMSSIASYLLGFLYPERYIEDYEFDDTLVEIFSEWTQDNKLRYPVRIYSNVESKELNKLYYEIKPGIPLAVYHNV